jgi:heme/copper-type cytochrome/quinol oxidase subunit 1
VINIGIKHYILLVTLVFTYCDISIFVTFKLVKKKNKRKKGKTFAF